MSTDANLLLLVGVLLPPKALDGLGPVVDERHLFTPYGTFGPVALRQGDDGPGVWIAPYTGLPTRTDPRATIFAATQLGVRRVLGWDMGIAINPALMRGQPVVAGDFIDFTFREPPTFANALAREKQDERKLLVPKFCPQMTSALQKVLPIAPPITYLGIDDVRRETPAEARMYRQWGADVIGQNLVPEILLAREAGLCFAGLISVSTYSADRPSPALHGELRAGLEMTMQILPDYTRYLTMLPDCNCFDS
jgi:5'-methylthioadenosine phosphorylase